MAYYRSGNHTVYDCRYHVVWITKYRKEWIHERLKEIVEDVLRDVCEELYVKVIRVGMEKDHVHMYLSIRLHTGHIPDVVRRMKGVSSKRLGEIEGMKEYFRKYYWKEGVGKWARGYFICTVGEVNDKLIKEYIESQGKSPPEVDAP